MGERKRVRHTTTENLLGVEAAKRDVADTEIIDLPRIKRGYYASGYARALMDVADGVVKVPEPKWSES